MRFKFEMILIVLFALSAAKAIVPNPVIKYTFEGAPDKTTVINYGTGGASFNAEVVGSVDPNSSIAGFGFGTEVLSNPFLAAGVGIDTNSTIGTDPANPFTVLVFLKATNLTGDRIFGVGQWQSTPGAPGGWEYRIYHNGTGFGTVLESWGTGATTVSGTELYSTNTPIMLAIAYDGQGKVDIYSIQKASVTLLPSLENVSFNFGMYNDVDYGTLSIGLVHRRLAGLLVGKFDDFMVWDTKLSVQEITEIYTGHGWTRKCSDLTNAERFLGDLDADCRVGFGDLAVIMSKWLQCYDPADPLNCSAL